MKRDWKQAIVFYLVYLVTLFVFSGAMGVGIAIIATPFRADHDFLKTMAKITGEVIAFIACPTIAALIIRAKKMRDYKALLLLLGTVFLSLGGGLPGLIIPAYLTSRPKRA